MLQIQKFGVILIVIALTTPSLCKKPLFKLKPRTTECGPASCHPTKPGLINVHLVPHSHDDTGWLKTVDEYYYGEKQDVQRAGVQYIIESVVKELANDPTKRFIQVETGFFWRWWEDKNDFMKNVTRQLVEAGQLVFTGGGWSMNDEAVTHYTSIIDNMETGLNWLVDTFGDCAIPDIAWQIDPFGHSKEQAKLFAEMGFKGLFFARIDQNDKDRRKGNKSLQMWWEGGEEGVKNHTIFTGVFDEHYSAPRGFCFDILCTDEPINDDSNLEEYNVEQKMQDFEQYVKDHIKYFKDQEHIMFTMGDDFNYQTAKMNYKNMDKLIKHMNARSEETGIHLLYSTPSCYLRELLSNENQVYPIKSDDFMPYANQPHSFWTGYFTSRPSVKLQERIGARDLTVARQLGVASHQTVQCEFDLHRAMGLMQHHDAVTGTEKQLVAEDYAQRLSFSTQQCQSENIPRILEKLGLPDNVFDLSVTSCPRLNISECQVSEVSNKFVVVLYNPLSRQVTHNTRIPLVDSGYTVHDINGTIIQSQVNQIPVHIKNIPGRNSLANYEILFPVDIPALGYTAFYLHKVEKNHGQKVHKVKKMKAKANAQEEPKSLKVLPSIDVKMQYYKGITGFGQSSGAYIFRPTEDGKQTIGDPVVSKINGPIVNEIIYKYSEWAIVTSRTYTDQDHVEVTWQVGPLVDGKEVVMVFNTGLNTSDFYTDANGRQMMKRKLNKDTFEKISGNYYPVTSRMDLRADADNVVTVISDRSQGGSSLVSGELELMVHRRCLNDDGYGVGEALMEEAFGKGLVARGQHFVSSSSLVRSRQLQQEKVLTPQLSIMDTSITLQEWTQMKLSPYTALKRQLPTNVQILTLSKWKKADEVLVRFQHIYSKDEDEKPIEIDTEGMFHEFDIVNLKEMMLAADRPIGDLDSLNFDLDPLEIRTFIARVNWA